MATLNSLQMRNPPFPVSGPGIGGRSIKMERAEFTGSAAAAGDVIQLFRLHPRFRVTGGYVKTDGMGTGVTITVGDAAVADRYFASASVATATVNTTMNPVGLDFATTAYTVVTATVAGATTNTTGVLTVVLFGTIEEPR